MSEITRNKNGTYSAYGVINGRPFVADMASLQGVQREFLTLKAQLIEAELTAQMIVTYTRDCMREAG